MKNRILILSVTILFAVLFVGGVSAQNKKKPDTAMMPEMMKSPHHTMMTAYRQNTVNFAKTLRDMARDSKMFDAEFARTAVAEIKRGAEMMDAIHQKHTDSMKPEMREKMSIMMAKMNKDQAALKEHIAALETLSQTASPNLKEIQMHAAAIVSQLEMMKMPDKPMKMSPGKKT